MNSRALGLSLLLPALAHAREAAPTVEQSPSATDAVKELLADSPRVVAFGEYHQVAATARTPSSLHHFIDDLLPLVPQVASDLIVETWVTDGVCGQVEQQAVAQVAKTTERPAVTEDEVMKLIRKAREAGLRPHILHLSCREYEGLLDEQGELDPVPLLGLVTDKLHQEIDRLLADRTVKGVAVYGGALHNDLHPRRELARYAFGAAVAKRTRGRYQEIDLYVPEFIERDDHIPKEPWYPRFVAASSAGRAVLVRRSPGSAIVLFPRQPAPPRPGLPPAR